MNRMPATTAVMTIQLRSLVSFLRLTVRAIDSIAATMNTTSMGKNSTSATT